MAFRLLTLFVIALSFGGCAGKKPESFTSDKPLYDYGVELFEDGSYEESITFFESLRNRFPQSPLAAEAELKIADAYFERREYQSAESSYQGFRTLHPTHAKVPYVLFQTGMCHFKQIPRGIDRDQTHTEKARDLFRDYLSLYPAGTDAGKSREMLDKSKRMLAERELYVANFYLKQKAYHAATLRLEGVRSNTDFGDLRAEAGVKLGHAYLKLDEPKKATEVLKEVVANPDAGRFRSEAEQLMKKFRL